MLKKGNYHPTGPIGDEFPLELQLQPHTSFKGGAERQGKNFHALTVVEFAIKQLDASDPPESTPTAPPRKPKKKTPVKYWL